MKRTGIKRKKQKETA